MIVCKLFGNLIVRWKRNYQQDDKVASQIDSKNAEESEIVVEVDNKVVRMPMPLIQVYEFLLKLRQTKEIGSLINEPCEFSGLTMRQMCPENKKGLVHDCLVTFDNNLQLGEQAECQIQL